jgi:hypothetical protein
MQPHAQEERGLEGGEAAAEDDDPGAGGHREPPFLEGLSTPDGATIRRRG